MNPLKIAQEAEMSIVESGKMEGGEKWTEWLVFWAGTLTIQSLLFPSHPSEIPCASYLLRKSMEPEENGTTGHFCIHVNVPLFVL